MENVDLLSFLLGSLLFSLLALGFHFLYEKIRKKGDK